MIDDLARESAALLCLRLCVWSLAGYANLSRKASSSFAAVVVTLFPSILYSFFFCGLFLWD